MSTRSCVECAAPLQPTDEFCILGHRASVEVGDDLAELRAKVNQAFEFAESQLQLLTADVPLEPEVAPVSVAAEPAPLSIQASAPAVPAPARRLAPPPPPPPLAPQLFSPLPTADADRADDPITAFAPAARLDWGPEKTRPSRAAGLLKRFNR